jgi:hypothetical protein
MHVPGLGEVAKEEGFNWYCSAPLPLSILDGRLGRIVLDGYEKDRAREDFHLAIANFLACGPSVLKSAEKYVFQYYQDMNSNWEPTDEEFVAIEHPSQVWEHVQLGTRPMVSRHRRGDRAVYVSLECNCDWGPEHGLQIVIRNGERVTKVGPYDGHLTNSDSHAEDGLDDVVYR